MAKAEEKAKVSAQAMRVERVPLDRITIGAQMLRHDPHDDDIQELAADIARRELLQPIGVCPAANGTFQLLWGSRRLAAHVRLARTHIIARICEPHTTEQILATAAVENLLRRNLTLAEEIDAIRRLTTEGRSPAEISDLVGKSRAWVDRRLAFTSLPLTIRDHVLEGRIPLGHAEQLALVTDDAAQLYLVNQVVQHQPTLSQLRATIEAIRQAPTFGEALEAAAQTAQSTAAPTSVYIGCHVCSKPHPIGELIIIRACAPCAGAMHNAAAPQPETDGPN